MLSTSIFITNNVEQECSNLISMYTDTGYVRKRILQSYPNLSQAKQVSVSRKIKSHIDQANSFLAGTDENVLTAPLTLFYAIQNYAKAIYLVNYPNFSLAGSHGIDFDNPIAESADEVGSVVCKMTKKGTFGNLIEVTGDTFCTGDSFLIKDIFSVIPELRENYYLRYFEEPNVFLLKKKKRCTSEYEMILQDEDVKSIANRDFSILDRNSFHLDFGESIGYVWKDASYTDEKGKQVLYTDIYGNMYCTNGISVNGKLVKISKIVSLYICYYAFSMLVRYHPEKWKLFCESSDVAIIRKLLTNCRREMLVEVIQLLSGKEYSFTTVMEEADAELDASELFEMVQKEARREFRRTGKEPFLF